MVKVVGFQTLDEMIAATVPASIRSSKPLSLSKPLTESQLIQKLQSIAGENNWDWRSFIGMGYYQCITPTVILRNVLENPGIRHTDRVLIQPFHLFDLNSSFFLSD
jgi:glycine dehydrogenase